jgi:hypothetical protein
MRSILDAAYHLVHDYREGAHALARFLNKAYVTLCHEVAGEGTAKLGLVDAAKLTQRTGNLAILNAFAAACSCMVLPLPKRGVALDTLPQLADTAKEFSEFVAEVAASMNDNEVTGNELARIDVELGQMIGAAQALRATLAQIHEAGKPVPLRKAA